MRVTILGSGSEGNALLLESLTSRVLVDAGISHRMLTRRLEAIGRSPKLSVDAVLVTHAHGDHSAHASTYAARFACPLIATKATLGAIRRAAVPTKDLEVGRHFRVGDITIRSKWIPHDAPQVALVFETKQSTVGLVTDLGHVPRGLERFVSDCETLLLESNHDPEMLEAGPYPAVVKRRVGSARGHLSNEQASDLLAKLPCSPRRVVLMHLSQSNNSPSLARASADAAIGHRRTDLLIAPAREALELPGLHDRQLQLGL